MAQKNIHNRRSPIGSGFIVIPEQIDREEYIAFCKTNQQATILTTEGHYIPEVLISNHVMDEIIYPKTFKELGSQVIFASLEYDSKPIIISVIPKQGESRFLGEGEFNIKRSFEDSTVEVSGSAKDGNISIVLNTNSASNFSLKVFGEESSVLIETDGKTTVKSSKNIDVHSFEELNLKSEDVEGEDLAKIQLKDGKVVLNEGKEPMLLGSTTKQQLEKEKSALTTLLDAISNLPPTPVTPGSPDPAWEAIALQLESILERADYSGIESENCSLD